MGLKPFSLKKIYSNLLNYGSESIEKLRSKTGLDLEISDRFMFKVGSIPKTKFFALKRAFGFENFNFLRNKIDLLNFIKKSQDGLMISNIISAYKGIKIDLISLAKFKGKERKLILIRGKTPLEISIFSFNTTLWIKISQTTINNWHLI